MAVRRILTIDKPSDLAILKKVSAPVAAVDDDVRALMDDMLQTMYAAPGIGLAAVQIGELKRIVVMDLGDGAPDADGPAGEDGQPQPRPNPRYFVNPEIVWRAEELAPFEEGCLSIPDYFEQIMRPARCRVRYLNYNGTLIEEEADGLYAVCIQHEMDHLEGVLFTDYLSRLKRERAMSAVKKWTRERAAA